MCRAGLLVALLAILAGCGSGSSAKDDQAAPAVVQVSTAKAVRGDVRASVSAVGVLAPLPNEEVSVAPLGPGRLARIFVKVGDAVSKGETIATLDPGAATGQLQTAQAAVDSAQAALREAEIGARSEASTHAQDLRQADLEVQAREVALEKLKAGSRPQEVAQAQASVAAARAALVSAQQSLTRSQTLYSQGLLARKDLEAAQTSLATARASLTSAQQALSMARQGNRPEDVRAGEVALAQAEQQRSAVRAQSIQRAVKEEQVKAAQGGLQSAVGQLAAARAAARSLSIESPVAGQVTARTLNPGESVDATSSIATIVNLSRVRLLLKVPAAEIGAIEPGDAVSFSTDADPSLARMARVTVVSQAIDPASNTVEVEAVADNGDRRLRDDGFVKAQIVTKVRRNAVLVPAAAVVAKDGKTSVFVAGADGLAHQRPVRLGERQGDVVEALSGVSEGDTLVTTGAFELDDGTKIKVAG